MNVTALAVIVDRAVTLGVGYWLNRTAKKEVKSAVKDIGPAIQTELKAISEQYAREAKQEIARAIQKLVPVILKGIKNASRTTTIRDGEPGTTSEPIQHRSGTDTN